MLLVSFRSFHNSSCIYQVFARSTLFRVFDFSCQILSFSFHENRIVFHKSSLSLLEESYSASVDLSFDFVAYNKTNISAKQENCPANQAKTTIVAPYNVCSVFIGEGNHMVDQNEKHRFVEEVYFILVVIVVRVIGAHVDNL